jgi:prevent-host-death family protein
MSSDPKLETITSSTLQRQIGTIIQRVAKQGETIVVTRDEWPVMVLLPISEYHALLRDRQRIDHAISRSSEDPTATDSIAARSAA